MKTRVGITCRALLLAACAAGLGTPQVAQAQSLSVNLPARDLGGALTTLARQANREIYFSAELTRPHRAPALHGRLSVEEALTQLLAGTGLRHRITAAGAIIIERASGEDTAGSAAAESTGAEIVVTGTNIRGIVPESSPLTVLNRRELDARGVTTAEQAVNSFTQNFNSVNADGTSADRAGFFNQFGVNGVDLRGLGPGTTLVLLNGRRLSGSSTGRVVDVSQIPLAAISRVELLTDSASSVYGSDAVGGVVNFILLDRFEGMEARAAYGMTSDGALDESRGSLTGGLNWSTGNLVASASYLTRSTLTADERSFSQGVGGRYSLSTPQERIGLFVTARQNIGDDLSVTADGLFNRRTSSFDLFRNLLTGGRPFERQTVYDQHADSWFGSFGATWRASDALTFDLVGSYSRIEEELVASETSTIATPLTQTTRSRSQTWDVTARASGRLFPLPGGNLAFSLGAGATGEKLANSALLESSAPPRLTALDRERRTYYAYGELNLPLIGAASSLPGISRLEFNLSARFSDYSDFGQDFSPKIGALWVVTPGFNLRGSFGRTFRAPYLADIGGVGLYQIFNVTQVGYPRPAPDAAPIGLYIDQGVDSDLGPETSNLLALGFDIRPPSVPRLSFSLTYVSIDYSDRIARGDSTRGTGYFRQPQLYQDLFNFSPTREDFAEIFSSATLGLGSNVTGFDLTSLEDVIANVGYILDNRLRNIAESRQQAVDVTAAYAFARGPVNYSIGANATLILESESRTTPRSPLIGQINTVGRPVDFRANAYAGLAVGPFAARLTGKYVGAYANPYTSASPVVDDWLTFDVTASYDFDERRGPLSGVAIYIAVQNLLNAAPPFVADVGPGVNDGLSEPIGYDPSNASPLGRFISIELRKRF